MIHVQNIFKFQIQIQSSVTCKILSKFQLKALDMEPTHIIIHRHHQWSLHWRHRDQNHRNHHWLP
jgi:hypothetical protein